MVDVQEQEFKLYRAITIISIHRFKFVPTAQLVQNLPLWREGVADYLF